ncbi:MAG: hypothetical protein ACKOPO_04730 [Novosphingobium sp.]
MRALAAIIGVLAMAMGLLWIGQGLGIIMWPSSSFMLADRQWAVNGAILAAVGAFLVWLGRRRRRN